MCHTSRPHHNHHNHHKAFDSRLPLFVQVSCGRTLVGGQWLTTRVRAPQGGDASDDSVRGGDTNGCRSHVPWQKRSTTPPAARGTTGGGWELLSTVPYAARRQPPGHGGRPRSTSLSATMRSCRPPGSGSFGRRRGICGAARRMTRSLPSMSLCCRWWNSQWKWTRSFANSCLRLPSRLSKYPSLLFLFVLSNARLCLSRSWWNSW